MQRCRPCSWQPPSHDIWSDVEIAVVDGLFDVVTQSDHGSDYRSGACAVNEIEGLMQWVFQHPLNFDENTKRVNAERSSSVKGQDEIRLRHVQLFHMRMSPPMMERADSRFV